MPPVLDALKIFLGAPPVAQAAGGLLVFGDVDNSGYVSQGYKLQVPNMQSQSNGEKNSFADHVRRFLVSYEADTHLQFIFRRDSNYMSEIRAYDNDTRNLATNEWTRMVRNERTLRYLEGIKNRTLNRNHLYLFISKKFNKNPPRLAGKARLEIFNRQILEEHARLFKEGANFAASSLGDYGRLVEMADLDYFALYRRWYNPSLAQEAECEDAYLPFQSLTRQTWRSGCRGNRSFGFTMDNHYHQMLVLDRAPNKTYPGISDYLTRLDFQDYALVVNVRPISVGQEIDREENKLERIQSDYLAEGKYRLRNRMERLQEKLDALSRGDTFPFYMDFIIHVWASTETELLTRVGMVRDAVESMNRAQVGIPNLPTTAQNLFYQSTPGWAWGNYTFRELYMKDENLAHILPLSSTPTAQLEGAEVLFDGEDGGLVGIKFQIDGTPQNGTCIGRSRAGKSALICEILSQSECFFEFSFLIDEGDSYATYAQTMGTQSVIFSPDADITLNYFDTQGTPLTGQQLTFAKTLMSRMAGSAASEETLQVRQGLLAHYVQIAYQNAYRHWLSKDSGREHEIAKEALAVARYRKTFCPAGTEMLEAWADLKDWQMREPDKNREFTSQITEEEVTNFLKEPETRHLVMRHAFSHFTRTEFPTHSTLLQTMSVYREKSHNQETISNLCALLKEWSYQGSNGKLFDGYLNQDFKGKLTIFELGRISEAATHLKNLSGFLLSNYIRQHIVSLPRRFRKRVVFEEAARFMGIDGGEKVMSEMYAQLPKFNSWILSVVQQYGRFKESKIANAVFGNSNQHYLLAQKSPEDVDDLGQRIDLPQIAKESILGHKMPQMIKTKPRYSSFTYYQVDERRPIIVNTRNISSPEMLYVSSSTPAEYDERQRVLKKYDSVLDGIVAEAAKSVPAKETT
jgi:type IV secretory pathway VirB4 component